MVLDSRQAFMDVAHAGNQARNNANKRLLESEDYADLTIECGHKTARVHKAIVCAGCEFFNLACKKDTFAEGKEGIIRLQYDENDPTSDDPEVVRLMLEYIYSMEYKVKTTYARDDLHYAAGSDRTLTTHAKVFAMAEKYNVHGLKDYARLSFKDMLDSGNAAAQDIAESIRIVFTTTPEKVTDLREIVSYKLTCIDNDLIDRAEVREAVESVDKLAYDLFKILHEDGRCDRIPTRPAARVYEDDDRRGSDY